MSGYYASGSGRRSRRALGLGVYPGGGSDEPLPPGCTIIMGCVLFAVVTMMIWSAGLFERDIAIAITLTITPISSYKDYSDTDFVDVEIQPDFIVRGSKGDLASLLDIRKPTNCTIEFLFRGGSWYPQILKILECG